MNVDIHRPTPVRFLGATILTTGTAAVRLEEVGGGQVTLYFADAEQIAAVEAQLAEARKMMLGTVRQEIEEDEG